MIKRRNYIWLVPLTLIVTFPAWRIPVAAFLTPRISYEKEPTGTGKSQNFSMENVSILQNKNGMVTAEIRAEKAFTTKVPNEYTLERVDADLYNAEGEPTRVVARRGTYDGTDMQLTLREDVVITKESENQRLYTELLHYDDKKQVVSCPDKTRIEGKDIVISGTGLDHDIARGTYELGGRVLCTIKGSIAP